MHKPLEFSNPGGEFGDDLSISASKREYKLPDNTRVTGTLRINRREPGEPYTLWLDTGDQATSQTIAAIGHNVDDAHSVWEKVSQAIHAYDREPFPGEEIPLSDLPSLPTRADINKIHEQK